MTEAKYEQKRSNEDRRQNYCSQHLVNSQDLSDIKKSLFEDIKPTVNKQTGQWTILLIVLGLFIITVWTANYRQGEKLDSVINTTNKIDVHVSEYIATHIQESKDGFRRIKNIETMITDHERRLNLLEKGH